MDKRLLMLLLSLLMLCSRLCAENGAEVIRRPIGPDAPAWILHIDCWNYPDPEKIIDLIPEDIQPFVIFSISLSSSDNITHSGPLIIDSWIRACATRGVWCMIQPSSGAHNRLPEITSDGTGRDIYERYYQDYPNFIGYSFAEQFWDFGAEGCPTWEERQETYIALLELAHQYGGYLTMSFTQSYDNCLMMPIGMLKNNAALRAAFEAYADHFICTEKTTMKKGFYDIESNCLGMWLSGYAGHYGIRFDTSGWMSNTDDLNQSTGNTFVEASALMPIVEHMLLTGQTVLDGPELTWQQVTRTSFTVVRDNWKIKSHALFPHCVNLYADIIRKVVDGDWRILSRSEVLARTKVCIVNDIASGNKAPYVTPRTLFDGLYRFNVDAGGVSYGAGWQDQRWWTKKSGRYPTIPQVYALLDDEASSLTTIPASTLNTRWPSTQTKVAELSGLFAPISSGEVFVARAGDTYVTYNPYQYNDSSAGGIRYFANAVKSVTGNIDSLDLTDGGTLRVYLNNYRNTYLTAPYAEAVPQTNRIIVRGLTAMPQVQWNDRANHSTSTLNTTFDDGNLTLTVTHNGPLDITVSDVHAIQPTIGMAYQPYTLGIITTDHAPQPLTAPVSPAVYTGVQQYEVENMDYQGSSITVLNHPGTNPASDYYGQGYVSVVPRTTSMLRDTLRIPEAGDYTLTIRYQSTATTSAIPFVLRLNGNEVTLPSAGKTSGWSELQTNVQLLAGTNILLLGFSAAWASSTVLLDCVQVRAKDPESGWNEVMAEPYQNDPSQGRYDVLGRPVSDDKKGIIIEKGRKYFVQ